MAPKKGHTQAAKALGKPPSAIRRADYDPRPARLAAAIRDPSLDYNATLKAIGFDWEQWLLDEADVTEDEYEGTSNSDSASQSGSDAGSSPELLVGFCWISSCCLPLFFI